LATDNQILHVISNETKSSIDQLEIVTPSVYASIFSQCATDHGETIENEPDLAYDIMQAECSSLSHLQEQASKNATQLSNSTSKAITAIQAKDEALLSEVLTETETLKVEIEKLKEAVYKDELTRVYNRKWLHDTFLEAGSNDFKEDGILIILDLNYFKQINDTHGHILGDKVLIFIANELRKSKQSIVRYGGDEFLILFDSSYSLKDALHTLHKIREDVLSKKLKAKESIFRVSFSIGGVEFYAKDSLSKIIAKADKNMYVDKHIIKKRITGIEF